MGLIRLIATAALVWFVFRWLDRFFGGPRKGPRKHTTDHDSKSGAQQRSSSPKEDGLGDYVDFEEINEP
ncbi:MAG TPA: hypothetical protein DD635_01315 [Flavobacteriales bacterium]|nr:hypothetical protein [Flavobacteriales bacterium]